MKITLNRCHACGTLFTDATRSPHDEDRCTSCDPALLTPTERMTALFRDCFPPRTTNG